jgi:hypothetical protein
MRGYDKEIYKDADGSVEAALTPNERESLAVYMVRHPGKGVDVNQNCNHRALCTRGRYLHTIIRNNGIMVDTCEGKPVKLVTAKDILMSQGWPIDAKAMEAACTGCIFSRGVPGPKGRTFRSVRNQVGNAMHICMMGSLMLYTVLKVPRLGVRKGIGKSPVKTSRFAAAFRLCKRDSR